MNTSYLLTGGNVGDRLQHLHQALLLIENHCGKVMKASSVYETAPWGNTGQPAFLNQVLCVQTNLAARSLLKHVLQIEESMGRKRMAKYGPRIIDIDILFFNSDIIRLPSLNVPHPEMSNRRFVLEPLEEIAADFVHPVFQIPVRVLLSRCPDPLGVKKFLHA